MNRERVLKSNELMLKIIRGEAIRERDIPDVDPEYRCSRCRDTGFVLEEGPGGTFSKRCRMCKDRLDADIRARAEEDGVTLPADTLSDPPIEDGGEEWWHR